jgi:hypothetical protein
MAPKVPITGSEVENFRLFVRGVSHGNWLQSHFRRDVEDRRTGASDTTASVSVCTSRPHLVHVARSVHCKDQNSGSGKVLAAVFSHGTQDPGCGQHYPLERLAALAIPSAQEASTRLLGGCAPDTRAAWSHGGSVAQQWHLTRCSVCRYSLCAYLCRCTELGA